MEQFLVQWTDRHREAQCPSDPAFPDGVDHDAAKGKPGCTVMLPYPAKRIGFYRVQCNVCHFSIVCTTAGRRDDPRSITIPCSRAGEA